MSNPGSVWDSENGLMSSPGVLAVALDLLFNVIVTSIDES
jgi:hypothetical protein